MSDRPSFTQEFRTRFRSAFIQATGSVTIGLLQPNGVEDAARYPCVEPYPVFGDRNPDNGQGGEYVLTYKFVIPIGVQYGIEAPIVGYKLYGENDHLATVKFTDSYYKAFELPGVVFYNIALV